MCIAQTADAEQNQEHLTRTIMKFNGGYNVMLEGEPSTGVATYQKPDVLHLPLNSDRLDFSLIQVEDGAAGVKGQILAKDPVNFSVPLLAPMAGTVNFECAERHITIENLAATADSDPAEVSDDDGERQTLLRLGVWASLARIDNNRVPDPERTPDALIVSIYRFEPFLPSPETVFKDGLDEFISGLSGLHKIFDDTTFYLVVPDSDSDVKRQLQQAVAENGWLNLFEVPQTYPFDHPAFAAQQLGLNPERVWSADIQAVIGAHQALGQNRPYTKRIISVAGPLAGEPCHHHLPIGYPLSLLKVQENDTECRVINGGVLTGNAIESTQLGLDIECQALTVLEEQTEREILAFVQPGFTKQSFSKTFASAFKPLFIEKLTTALGGESRPCVFCGFCEKVCPVGIIPHLVYRYLDNDRPEDAYRVEFDKCIDCGLCSYVCVSKINHLKLFRAERVRAITELIEG